MSAAAIAVSVRDGEDRDSVLGIRPKLVFAPESPEQAAALLVRSASEGLRLAFVGGGTDLDLGFPPERIDAVVRTERMARIVEHAPSDQIVVAEAGVTLAQLQRTAAAHGQRLALDPPSPERATLGGLVAANAFGPLRARYGSVRDLIIGVSIVRADGVAARGGGKVVKTVAGFDLPKLMVGSLGTLGLITTATFRLHPMPETGVTVRLTGLSPRQIRGLVADIRRAQLEPASVVAVTPSGPPAGGRLDVAVTFEGFEAGVRQQRDRFVALVAKDAARCEVLDEDAARAFCASHDRVRAAGSLRAKLAAPASAIEPVLSEAVAPVLAALEGPGLVWYPTLGLGFLSGDPGRPEDVAAAIASAREILAGLSGSLTLGAAPPAVRARVDVWGEKPAAWPLMLAMKARLDPERRLSPGRFVGGI